jgi:hypothetical protein
MVVDFRTKVNMNGNHYFLRINFEGKCFTREQDTIHYDGIVVTKRDYDTLHRMCKEWEYTEY